MLLATAEQMKRVDDRAIRGLGIPSLTLMENAAHGIVEAIAAKFLGTAPLRVAVFCGSGNNGGDGACAAGYLLAQGHTVRCFLVGSREKFSPDMAEMVRRLEEQGGAAENYTPEADAYVLSCDVVLDAMFGVGLSGALREPAATAAALINRSPAWVVAADMASGVLTNSGETPGAAVRADCTVTFSMAKPGHFLDPGGVNCGKLIVHDIGIPKEAMAGESFPISSFAEDDLDAVIPIRNELSHKGNYGKVLMLCGSVGYTGAAAMTAQAALRTGSGLVFLGVPAAVYPIAAAAQREAMVFPLADRDGMLSEDALREIGKRMGGKDVILVGPGLGRGPGPEAVVSFVLENAEVPVVLDADGLNALAGHIDILDRVRVPVVLTPHDGEYLRLGGTLTGDRLRDALAFARAHGCILALKGHRSITALPDGRAWVNTAGNAGMARGGSGDVLSGVIASLIGQGMEPGVAVAAGQYLHAAAGDLCAREIGQYGMLPTDMIERIPRLLRKYQKESE